MKSPKFKINALDINNPKAIVYDGDDRERLIIELSQNIHLWHIEMVLAAYRIYWTAEGLRDTALNDRTSVFIEIPDEDNEADMIFLSKALIDSVCKNGTNDQPNLLRKVNEGRYTLLRRIDGLEYYVSGGYNYPYYFVRKVRDSEVLQRFADFDDALKFKL